MDLGYNYHVRAEGNVTPLNPLGMSLLFAYYFSAFEHQ